jgi:hypothetical protein
MPTKTTLREWIANGEWKRLFKALQAIAEQLNDTDFLNSVFHQTGRFSSIQKNLNDGIIDQPYYNMELAKIRLAVLNLIDNIPDHATLSTDSASPPANPPVSPPTSGNGGVPSPTPPDDSPKPATPVKPPSNAIWITGLVVLVGVTLLAALIPCPGDFLSGTTQVLMAIGAAMAATALPGLLNIELPTVKAGSALAVLVLVYLFNPAKLVENNSACNNEPFDFTINLQPDQAVRVSNQYPKLKNAILQIWIGNDWRTDTVDANNLARYYSLPGDYKDQKVAVKLVGNYWYLKEDSVQLSGKSQVLTILPNGTLGTVTGRVIDAKANPVKDVKIEIVGIITYTNENGIFTLQVPLDKQRSNYEVYATKAPFISSKSNAAPSTGQDVKILLLK